MKKWAVLFVCMLLTLLCVCALADVEINRDHFPDANFREYVRQFDTDGDGVLSNGEIAVVTKMVVPNEDISDLKGIEYLTALEKLDCSYNKLTALDVSRNTGLAALECENNRLATLDVSKNTRLKELCCHSNQLTALNISKNTNLEYLYCDNNNLSTLNVSKNRKLAYLWCEGNSFARLDVSKCPKLIRAVKQYARKTEGQTDYFGTSSECPVLSVDRTVTVTAGSITSKPILKNVSATVNELNYRLDFGKETAVFTGAKDRNVKSVKIPDTVQYRRVKFRVTEIASDACAFLDSLQEVTIGKNVRKIGARAFNGCPKAKKITIKTTLLTAKNVGNNAFAIEYKKPTVKCPASKLDEYKKFLPKKGMPKKTKYTK